MGTLSVASLGTLGYALFQAKEELHTLGLIAIICAAVLIISSTVLAVAVGIRLAIRAEYVDIGQYGTVIDRFGRQTYIEPANVRKLKEHTPELETVKATEFPSIDDLLEEGLLGVGKLVLGFLEDGTLREGKWDELRTFAVAGVSATGKTTTLFFLIIQMLLNLADVTICDPHWSKGRGLTKMLEHLHPWLNLSGKNEEIKIAVDSFHSELQRRMNGEEYHGPKVLVIDEWTQLAVDKGLLAMIVETIELTARAGAGYDCYVILSGHLWQPSACGGSKVKDSLHAAIVHRLPDSQSRHLLDRPFYSYTPKLAVGRVFIYDTQGETTQCIIPSGTRYTGRLVAELLLREGVTTRVIEEQPPLLETANRSTTQPLNSGSAVQPVESDLEPALKAWKDGAKSQNTLAQALHINRHQAIRLIDRMKGAGLI